MNTKSKPAHYRTHHDAKSLFATLRKEVNPGDSIQQVQELLGKGEPPTDRARLLASCKKFAQRLPDSYRDGVWDEDEFVGYSYRGTTLFLQFREGRLINFNPKEFEKVPELFAGRLD